LSISSAFSLGVLGRLPVDTLPPGFAAIVSVMLFSVSLLLGRLPVNKLPPELAVTVVSVMLLALFFRLGRQPHMNNFLNPAFEKEGCQ
jgi:hypothetical protein